MSERFVRSFRSPAPKTQPMGSTMAFEQRNMTGTLFRNESTNEKAPSHKGKVVIGGVEYPIAAWIKEGANGQFFSIKVEEPTGTRSSAGRGEYQPRKRTPGEMPLPPASGPGRKKAIADDDDIPFQKEWR